MPNAQESLALPARAPAVATRSGSSPCSKAAALVCLLQAALHQVHEPARVQGAVGA